MTDAAAEKKDWQKGIPIEELKKISAIFRASMGPHIHGAFGLPKERDIAAAMSADLLWQRQQGGEVNAVAIVQKMGTDSHPRDFRGLPILIPKGATMIHAFGYTNFEAAMGLLGAIPGSPELFLEWCREDEPLSQLVAESGFTTIATKISAASDILAVAQKSAGKPPGQIDRIIPEPVAPEDRIAIGQLEPAVASSVQLAGILAEIGRVASWQQHYSSYNKRSSWTAIALRGFDAADPGFIIKPAEMSKGWKAEKQNQRHLVASPAWTPAAEKMPETKALALQIFDQLDVRTPAAERVRLMRLDPGGGELSRHADITDRNAGTRDRQIVRLHIPIQTSPECRFSAWSLDGKRLDWSMPAGCLCYLDQRKPHTVVNGHPTQPRIHLVLDVPSNERIRELLRRADPSHG